MKLPSKPRESDLPHAQKRGRSSLRGWEWGLGTLLDLPLQHTRLALGPTGQLPGTAHEITT